MEVSLRKPQREIFELSKKNEGSFFRLYKKSLSAKREYYRLLTKDFSPIKNISRSKMKPLFNLSIIETLDSGCYAIKPTVTLAEKKSKNKN